ncbi:alpha-amylase family glycosyl hydrolase [Thermoleptolyngbya sp. M55_K2018_002]|uniref:alpha-amylase family glycosyl hydrolase n=1 Tax=Thermoleptolyngbya sp. M55_K2018_002 TaxID=2747808 RepID=UPI0019F3A384|nr:alpha-amylase family glycosyl hydrolase [Thermoleptolyngbya sp. M55_K2018_002]HIK43233.1 alpha-amylase [Thermoleptolyngbya sp. M55_K2018_002]
MLTVIEPQAPRRLADADLNPRGRVFPSPLSWRDQFLYQLLPDRFSDGREGERPMFDRHRPEQFRAESKAAWMAAGNRFNGGTLKGILSKLDYLQTLGVTTLWLNPPWKQRIDSETYHGYGIQNFLEVDPRFGTRQDLRDLVDAAHDRGMYVVLDIIYNHSGSNWYYRGPEGSPAETMPYRFSPPYEIHGWRSHDSRSIPQPLTLEDGVFPEEFQNPDWYNRAGMISQWEVSPWEDPLNPYVEFRQGDFFELRDFNLENKETLSALAKVYQYWIALTDCDGFRVDAVKHVSPASSRRFCSEIHGYAQAIGKENFLLAGELTDENLVQGYRDIFGRNLDSVLDIAAAPNNLMALVKGLGHPGAYFGLYDEAQLSGSIRQLGTYHVSVLDDHDMCSRPTKQRFAAGSDLPTRYHQAAHAVGVMLTMPGVPSIYYGTEQALDGSESDHDYGIEPQHAYIDRYIRECMFGGKFGAFGTEGCHFFNPQHPTYLRIAAIARVRQRPDRIGRALRRGQHYPRETSFMDRPFSYPGAGELAAWSQIQFNAEVLMVLNTHGTEGRGAYVTIDRSLHPNGSTMTVLYNSDWSDEQLQNPPTDETVTVEHYQDRRVVYVSLPPAGMMILA